MKSFLFSVKDGHVHGVGFAATPDNHPPYGGIIRVTSGWSNVVGRKVFSITQALRCVVRVKQNQGYVHYLSHI
jgi:hypothetical protein